ncbi:unnamed protein product, partial [Meganyctiphanes norvegica]
MTPISEKIPFSDEIKRLDVKTMNLGASVRVNKYGIGIIIACVVIVYLLYRGGEATDTGELIAPPGPVSLRQLLAASIDAAEQGGKKVNYHMGYAVLPFTDPMGVTMETPPNILRIAKMASNTPLTFPM